MKSLRTVIIMRVVDNDFTMSHFQITTFTIVHTSDVDSARIKKSR